MFLLDNLCVLTETHGRIFLRVSFQENKKLTPNVAALSSSENTSFLPQVFLIQGMVTNYTVLVYDIIV